MKIKLQSKEKMRFFDVSRNYPLFKKQPFKLLHSWVDYITGVAWFYNQTDAAQESSAFDECTVARQIFPYLDIKHHISFPKVNPLLKPGGKIIVANHEGLLLDGLFFAWMLDQYKSNFKFIASSALTIFPLPQDFFFFLDIRLIQQRDVKKNALLYRKIISWLENGGVIIVFPETHYKEKSSEKCEKILPWSNLPIKLAKIACVPIIPIKLNVPSPFFIKLLRASLLFFYNMNMRRTARIFYNLHGVFACQQIKFASGKSVSCVVGPELNFEINGEMMKGNYLRDYVYQL